MTNYGRTPFMTQVSGHGVHLTPTKAHPRHSSSTELTHIKACEIIAADARDAASPCYSFFWIALRRIRILFVEASTPCGFFRSSPRQAAVAGAKNSFHA